MSKKPAKNKNLQQFLKKAKDRIHHIITSPVRTFKALCFMTGLFFWLTVIASSFVVYGFLSSLPDIGNMKYSEIKRHAKKRIYTRFEKKGGKHIWTPITSVNRDFLFAIIMSEDRTFFEHSGVNYGAIIQAFATNLKKGRPVVGGSTISQQVAKNLYLSTSKTLLRKIKEVIITKRLEERLTKNEILEIYLNMAEFGPDIYGVESASRNMFGKKPSKINAAEGAYIALMLPSPRRNFYSIFQNRNLSEKRRSKIYTVLRGMLYSEYISQRQFNRYTRYNFNARLRRSIASQ